MAERDALLNGRFIIGAPIGQGAQGHTFDGIDTHAAEGTRSRAVAIKRFDVRGATSWKDVELAEREARVLKALDHPRLPAYVDHFEQDGALYLVMEKIAGESLAEMKKRGAVLDEDEVLRLLRDASEVLDYLHGRAPPVIHRDLKPGNVVRRPDGSFAFVDFGAVRDKLRPKGGSTVVGTFGYMAPEQVQGRALPASDVYAIGATALSMLTGSEPEDLPHRGLAIDVRAALRQSRGERASARIAPLLERMLDPDPDRRASRIAPLLSGSRRDPASEGARRASAAYESVTAAYQSAGAAYELAGAAMHEAWDRRAKRYARHAERNARRAATRAARHAERAARRAERWHRSGPRFFPWPARLLFTLVFTAGIVAVLLATQVIVPFVLRMVSLFVAGRALREAADSVRAAGSEAVDGMARSRRWFLGNVPAVSPEPPSDEPVARTSDSPVHAARVADPHVRVADAGSRIANEEEKGPHETNEEEDAPLEGSSRPRAQR